MFNIRKIILINLIFVCLINLFIFIYFNLTNYKSKILYRLNFNLDHLIHEYTDLQVHEKILGFKKKFPDYNSTNRRFLLYDFINYIYSSDAFEVLKKKYKVSKVLKGTQVDENKKQESGLLQIQLILNDYEDHYKISQEISAYLEEIIKDYNKSITNKLQTQKLEFIDFFLNQSLKETVNKAIVKDIAKKISDQNIKNLIININDQEFQDFLNKSKQKFSKDPNYLGTNEFKYDAYKFYFDNIDEFYNDDLLILDEVSEKFYSDLISKFDFNSIIENIIMDEYYKYIFSKDFPELRKLTKNHYNFNSLENFGITLKNNFKINSNRLNPSKQNLHLSISILSIGFINLIYIMVFRLKYLIQK